MNIEDKINEWCNIISFDIAERKFYNKDEMAAYAKVKLLVAISDCLDLQKSDLVLQRLELVKKYTSAGGSERFKAGHELAIINKKIKDRNITLKNIEDLGKAKEKYTPKPKEIVCTNSGAWILCRIKKITPFTGIWGGFSANANFNKNLIDCNESNYLTFVLKKDKADLLSGFNINDVVKVKYTILSSCIDKQTQKYAHNLICSDIKLHIYGEKEGGEQNAQECDATDAQ